MIANPIVYHRDYINDVQFGPTENEAWTRCQNIAAKSFQLLSLIEPFRGPMTIGLGGLRAISHIQAFFTHFDKKEFSEGLYHLGHAIISVATIGLAFFQATLALVITSLSDIVESSREAYLALSEGNWKKGLEALFSASISLFFIASICSPSIEFTVAVLLLQIIFSLYRGTDNFIAGDYFEGVMDILTAGLFINAAKPQAEFCYWKHKYGWKFEAEVKQDARGFVYLDLPDEMVYSMNKHLGSSGTSLPPYFGKNRYGAHVSVALANEKAQLPKEWVGKTIHFSPYGVRSVNPYGWNGVDRVWFVSLSCQEAERLRRECGLSPKINGDHDFHITYGIHKSA